MNYKIIFILAISSALAIKAIAKSTWIHVTGIDEKNQSQNYGSFYSEAKDFDKLCNSLKNRDCVTFINPNLKLMSADDLKSDQLAAKVFGTKVDQFYKFSQNYATANKGTEKSKVLQTLEQALKNAQPGEQVVFALSNHGFPNPDGSSPSCIQLNNKESICENELKSFLEKNPVKPGVRLLVVGDGCFSGGFVSLSKSNVCVVVTAPQKNFGYSGTSAFWRLIRDSNIQKLSDMTKNTNSRAFAQRTASQVGLFQRCQKIRDYLTENKINPGLFEQLLKARNETPSFCNLDDSIKIEFSREFISNIKIMQGVFQNLFNINFGKNACERTDPETCQKIKEFVKSGTGLLSLGQLDAAQTQAEEVKKTFDEKTKNVYLQFEENEWLIRVNPDLIKKVKPSRRALVQRLMKELDAIDKAFETASEPIFRKIEPIFKDPKIFDSISELWPCFSSPKAENGYWITVADQYKDLVLSDQAIKDAQKCESEFSFQ